MWKEEKLNIPHKHQNINSRSLQYVNVNYSSYLEELKKMENLMKI